MLLTAMPQITVFAAEVIDICMCRGNLTWSLDTSTGVFTITGTGAMNIYASSSRAPWYSYRSYIKNVVINNRVTSIGDNAFQYCSDLTKYMV